MNLAVLCCILHGITKKCRIFRPQKSKEGEELHEKMQDESYTRPLSYTLSYTGNSQYIKGFSWIGVGM